MLERLGIGLGYDESQAPVELKRVEVKIKSVQDQIQDAENRLEDLEEGEGEYI